MLTAAWLALPYSEERERSRRKARNGLIAAFFVILATYAAVYIALGQETVRNIGLSGRGKIKKSNSFNIVNDITV